MGKNAFLDRVRRKVCTGCETPRGVHYSTRCLNCHKRHQEGVLDWQVKESEGQKELDIAKKRAEESAGKVVGNLSAAVHLILILAGFFFLYVVVVTIFNVITGNSGDSSGAPTFDCRRDPIYCEQLETQQYDDYDWVRPYGRR